MKSTMILFVLVFSLLQSCGQPSVLLELEKTKESFKREYIIPIHDHFPQKINGRQIINATFLRPDSFSYFGCSLLTLKLSETEIDEIKNGKYLAKLHANNDSMFFVSIEIVRDCEKLDTNIDYKNLYPVANINDVDFQLGEIEDSVYIQEANKYYPIDKYVIPDDMEIIIIDFACGNFWISDKYNEKRCEKIGHMKNGYSYGYAISEKFKYVTYWAVAW